MNNGEMTISQLIAFAKSSNSALTQFVGRDGKGNPVWVIAAAVGQEQAAELLKLLATMQTVEQGGN